MRLQEKLRLRFVIPDHILVAEDDDNIREGLIDVRESIEGAALPLTTPAHDVVHQKVIFDRHGISSFALL